MTVFCKYGHGPDADAYDAWRGVTYEANVYQHILQPSEVSTPRYYGRYSDPRRGVTLIALEYVHDRECAQSEAALSLAARWIARFHEHNEARCSTRAAAFLTVFDREYYLRWVRRTAAFADLSGEGHPWLAALCKRPDDFLALLLEGSPTVIHGDYYPANILFQHGVIRPVDWETAAIAPGEVDLACLTDGWMPALTRRCDLEYQQARWPEGAPDQFHRTLEAARLYVHFRWLGERAESIREEGWRFEGLRAGAERLGLI